MADDLRLYFFECGHLKTYTQFIKMNEGMNDSFEAPVPFFLITHPRGNVRFDVQSHLHLDHSGAVGHFPNAEYVVQRRELEYAYTPDWFQKPAYIRSDFDRDVNWLFLDGEHDDGYDLYGDGTLKTLFTPGHAPGHISLMVTLEETGPVMLTSDACYTMDHYNNEALPGLIHSAHDVAASVQKIHRAVDAVGAMVVTGHDPGEWPNFKKAPEYYS